MNYWIFQGNPNRFDINRYLSINKYIYWSVKYPKHQEQIQIGDVVFLWRSMGKIGEKAGIVGKGVVIENCKPKNEVDHYEYLSDYLWDSPGQEVSDVKVGIKLKEVRLGLHTGMLERNKIENDSILKNLSIVRSRVGSNFLLNRLQSSRMNELWSANYQIRNIFHPPIKQGDIINNKDLSNIFLCSEQGGMRRSHRTNSLVLISDKTRGIYQDRWTGNLLYYTGMGLSGKQSLVFAQNKTLNESKITGINVFLFEVFNRGKYIYQGRVSLADKPFQESQMDSENNVRSVWIFQLKLDNPTYSEINLQTILDIEENESKQAKKLSDAELLERMSRFTYKQKKINSHTNGRTVRSTYYSRNPYVSEFVKRRAQGQCQLCGLDAPFNNKMNEPYLEAHHIKWLSKGGSDSTDNAVALCPNCHRKMHIINLNEDKKKLKELVKII